MSSQTPVDLLVLLQACGPPPHFEIADTAREPFAAYDRLNCSRAARMHFMRDSELARGIMIVAFADDRACASALRRIAKGEALGDPSQNNEQASARLRKFFDAHEDLRSRMPPGLEDEDDEELSELFQGLPYTYVALERVGNVLVSMGASGCALEERAGLDAYLQSVTDALRVATADPAVVERQVAPARERLRERLVRDVGREVQVLATKFQQRIRRDDYGNEDYSAALPEVRYFADRVVTPRLDLTALERQILMDVLLDLARTAIFDVDSTPGTVLHGRPSDGSSFEMACAEILRQHGWNARVTKASGDQGVDVIATRGDIKVTLQCKLYSTPVGNKAVQEALAGKTFERADFAAVVTNSTYTQAAKQLAAMSGVLLLRPSDLPQLAILCGLGDRFDGELSKPD